MNPHHLTTHVLDSATGTPAAGVPVTLTSSDGAVIAVGATDTDGRLALGPERLGPGNYSLTFVTAAFSTFYPQVTITFTVDDLEHYHVPLLLSPFAYSTYRGS